TGKLRIGTARFSCLFKQALCFLNQSGSLESGSKTRLHLGGLAFDEELLPKRKGFLEKTVVVQKEREISFGGQVETITLEHTLPKRGGFNGFDPVFLVTGKDQDRAI